MNRKLVFLVIVLLGAVLLPARWAAAFRTIDGATHLLLPGLSARGYLLSDDDMALYTVYAPQGMTLRPRIEVDRASRLRLQARVDMWPNDLVDDSCDDPVIEFEVRDWESAPEIFVQPCPGLLDIDTPYHITIGYDMPLLEIEPNDLYPDQMYLNTYEAFTDYHGAIDPADDLDRYTFEGTGRTTRITMTRLSGTLQPRIELIGNNVYVWSVNCGGAADSACIEMVTPAYQTLYLIASGAAGQGEYALSFDFGDNMTGEPNNTPDDWGHASYGRFQAIDPVGDVDYVNFGGREGDVLRLRFDSPEGVGLARAQVEILDPNLNVIEHDILTRDHPGFDFVMPGWEGPGRFLLRVSDADNGAGDPEAIYYQISVDWIGPYVSSTTDGLGSRYSRRRNDLLVREYDSRGDLYWSLVFDASDVGITQNVTAAEFLPNGTLLLALDRPQTVPGLGTVKPHDIIRFVPAPYGLSEGTRGVFEWYLDGSDVGLSTTGEKIDAIALSGTDPDNFDLVISLSGSGRVPRAGGGDLAVADEDLIRLEGAQFGPVSAGAWMPYLDGSTVPGMAAEDIGGATLLRSTEWRAARGASLLLMREAFVLDGVAGNARDVLLAWQGFSPAALDIVGLAPDNLGDKNLDAITIGPVIED